MVIDHMSIRRVSNVSPSEKHVWALLTLDIVVLLWYVLIRVEICMTFRQCESYPLDQYLGLAQQLIKDK